MSKPVAVLIHGFLGHTSDWDAVAARLDLSFDVRRVFLPGHDRSVRDKMDGWGFDDAVAATASRIGACDLLVGYSMGGRIALDAVLSGRVRPRAVVIVSSSIGIADAAEREARRADDRARADAIVRDGLPAFLRAWYRMPLFSSLDARPELREKLVALRSAGDAESLAEAMRAMTVGGQPHYGDALARCELPILFLAGDRDPVYARAMADAARLSRRGSHRIVHGSGHMPHIEAAHETADAIVEFWNTEAR